MAGAEEAIRAFASRPFLLGEYRAESERRAEGVIKYKENVKSFQAFCTLRTALKDSNKFSSAIAPSQAAVTESSRRDRSTSSRLECSLIVQVTLHHFTGRSQVSQGFRNGAKLLSARRKHVATFLAGLAVLSPM